MKISVEQPELDYPVTVMQLEGALDASCYLEVIEKAKSIYLAGTRDLLLDFSQLTFMSSAGLVALHSIALIMRGELPPDPESGWSVFHAMSHDIEQSVQLEKHCKLLNPQPRVVKTLKITGYDRILAVYTDKQEALASFSA